MKKHVLSFFNISLIAVFFAAILSFAPQIAKADEIYTVGIEGEFCQTEARQMLSLINSFRTGPDAWAWNAANTQKVYSYDLTTLKYDYNLEKVAMQRAAEIAICWSHTRPDNSSWYSAYSELGLSYNGAGENLASGYKSAEAAFTGLLEADKSYSGQGHRRNMLGNYNRVGIAVLKVNGWYLYVQEFGYKATDTDISFTSPLDAVSITSVQLSSANIKSVSLSPAASTLVISSEEDTALPSISVTFKTTNSYPTTYSYTNAYGAIWSTNSDGVIYVDNDAGTITPLRVDSTRLYCSALGTTQEYTVEVEGAIVNSAAVSVGSDLVLHVNTYISSNFTNPQLTFTMNDEAVTVSGTNDGTACTFSYPGICSDNMTDVICMELADGDTLLYSGQYSIEEYCDALYSECASDGISSEDESLFRLLSDMLLFGAASQNYTGHNTNNLAGGLSWVNDYKSSFTSAPVSIYETRVYSASEGDSIDAVGASISSDVKLYVLFSAASATHLVITRNDISCRYELSELSPEDGTYKVYTEGLMATELGDVFTISLYNGETLLNEIVYGLDSYIAKYCESDNVQLRDIVRAVHLYSVSASNLSSCS